MDGSTQDGQAPSAPRSDPDTPSAERPPERGAPRPTPRVFGPAEGQLFGLHHAPDPRAARGTGVILCNPLGYEAMCAHRTYRHLAERLSGAGFHTLRFDYRGTGDSSGDDDEAHRLRAWLGSIDAAVEELRAVAGVDAVVLVGLRFGATLAALAAARRRDVQGLVLWAPCASGRAYLRELRAFRMLAKHDGDGAPGEGDEAAAGHGFDRASADEIAAIDLLAGRERIAERALVVARDDLPDGAQRLSSHLEACGVEVRLRAAPGYASMMRDPQDVQVPAEALDEVVAWIGEPREPSLGGPGARRAPWAGASPPVLVASSHAARLPVREEPLYFGEDSGLFGVLTEPGGGSARRGAPAIVFLNVGANHRVGPNRMYVTLARDLAARGYLAFRFDLAGLGDSLATRGAPENRLYSRDSIRDVKAALGTLSRVRGVDRVVLAGVCSGAYLAYHTALDDPRVAGQILVNIQTFAWKEGDSLELLARKSYKSTRYYKRALFDREVWAQALRGELDVRGVAGVLRERGVVRAEASIRALWARGLGRPPWRTDVERSFCALSDRGVASLLVFASTDGGLDMIEEHLGPEACRVRGRGNIRLAVVEGADHTFTPPASQRELFTLITRFVEEAFP